MSKWLIDTLDTLLLRTNARLDEAKGFVAYFAQDFEFARQLFTEALRYRLHDFAANALIQRIDAITPEMLESGWDGSVALAEK